MKKFFVIDPSAIFRAGVKSSVSGLSGIACAGEGRDVWTVLEELLTLQPELLLISLDLHAGSSDAEMLLRKPVEGKIVFFIEDSDVVRSWKGVASIRFISRNCSVQELCSLVTELCGERDSCDQSPEKRSKEDAEAGNFLSQLTPSEKAVIRLVAEGFTSREIAGKFHISVNTIENHRANMIKKLDLNGKNSLLKFAMQRRDLL
jgi:DNA-binding NarL/FixJ family response regulator